MTVHELISDLRRKDVRLWLEGSTLRYSAPQGALTPPLIDALRRHKPALVTLLGQAAPSAEPIQSVSRDEPLPLSFGQQRLWFIDRLEGGSLHYHQQGAFRVRGALDLDALQHAVDGIAKRHEVLRTSFVAGEDGQPLTRIYPAIDSRIRVVDLGAEGANCDAQVCRIAAAEAAGPFDLATGPLFRVTLLRHAHDESVLLVTLHHIVSDGWSISIVARELAALYTAYHAGRPSPLPALPIQYGDVAAWQRRQPEARQYQGLEYWTSLLAGIPPLNVPLDRARPATPTFRGAEHAFVLPRELVAPLRALGHTENATLFMTLLAAFECLLARWSGQTAFALGTPVAGRSRPETENLIGFFVNTLALPARLDGDPTFREALARVRMTSLESFTHQDAPFERLLEALNVDRDLARHPLFQVMFVLQNTPDATLRLPELALEPLRLPTATSKFDLTLFLEERHDSIDGRFEYAADLFTPATVARLAERFCALLSAVVRDPGQRLSELPVLSKEEHGLLQTAARGADIAYPNACLHRLIEEQVDRTPDALALVFEGRTLSFGEVEERANRIAHRLIALGVRPDDRVGVCTERSLEMPLALLAVLKAGAAYLPLDPDHPQERLRALVEDARPRVLLVAGGLADRLADTGVPTLRIEDACASGDAARPHVSMSADHLAYVIYTSGSTGRPKGVASTHRGIVNRLAWMQARYGLRADDRVLQKTPFGFDVSVWEFFWPLMTGVPLVVAPPDLHRDARGLSRLIVAEQITTVHFVPSMLDVFVDEPTSATCTPLRRVVSSGEALPPATVTRFASRLPQTELHNLYGPTEASVDVSAWVCTSEHDAVTVPIGLPIANTQLFVLDPNLELAPIGAPGELYIGGVGLARGYLHRPALTADRFVPNPFSDTPGSRLYRTGDLARVRDDGAIEYLGRNDHQVKVRGFRVELEEIEVTLGRHPDVRTAVVTTDGGAPPQLVAFVVADAAVANQELAAWLSHRLPAFMVPSRFERRTALPLSSNGKLDRSALRVAHTQPEHPVSGAVPRTEPEQRLADVWREALGNDAIGVRDDFFAVGGDSIRALRVIARARAAGFDVELKDLFRLRTIEAMAAVAGRVTAPKEEALASLLSDDDRSALAPLDLDDAYPMSALQLGMVFHSDLAPDSAVYHDVFSYRLAFRFDAAAFRTALEELTARHPALRTSFALSGLSTPVQRVHRDARIPLEVLDLRTQEPELQARTLAAWLEAERCRPFDWTQPPLLRFAAHMLADDVAQLTISFHHSILDGWSVATLLTELFAGVLARGRNRGLPALPPPTAAIPAFIALEREAQVSPDSRDFWASRLAEAPFEALPRLGDGRAPRLRNRMVVIDDDVRRGLEALAACADAPLKSALLAVHLRVCAALTGHADVITGLVTNGRPESEGAERTLGLFLNTLPLRLSLHGTTWTSATRSVFEREREIMPHRRVPLSILRRAHGALFDTAFNYVHFHVYSALGDADGVRLLAADAFEQTDLPLLANFTTDPTTGALSLRVAFTDPAFSEEQLDQIADYYGRALRAAAARPGAVALADDPLGHEEHAWLHATAQGEPLRSAQSATLPMLFEAQVARTPDAMAVRDANSALTYAELDARATALAQRLRAAAIGVESRVGVGLPRTVDLVVALLAVLKSGAAYVPLDPAYPAERLSFVRDDASVAALITDPSLTDRVPVGDRPVFRVADGGVPPSAEPGPPPLPASIAYLIYTSGSTGRPKGVAITHANAVAFVTWARSVFSAAELSGVLASTSICFDLSIFEIFVPLATGGCVLLADSALDLAAMPGRSAVTLVNTVPSAMDALLRTGALPPSVRTVNLAGEPLSVDLVQRLYATGIERVYDLYGPSEDTTYSTFALRSPERPATIGRPIAGTQAYVLDARLMPVPVGVTGELCLAGAGLARGYLGRPGLTASRFIPDPFGVAPGGRLYCTGDLARWRSDGRLEFLGRIDRQVKIRGFRIEPGEVEAALAMLPGVSGAVVVPRADANGSPRLLAYVAPAEAARDPSALRAALRIRLPEHFIPSTIVGISSIPRLPNGKIDHRALPEPAGDAAGTPYVAPRNDREAALASMMSAVLGVTHVGIHDNFFERGGHSLSATQLVARIRAELGLNVPLRALFTESTVATLAHRLDSAPRVAVGFRSRRRTAPDGVRPLSFAERRLWLLEQLSPGLPTYNIPVVLRIRGPLAVETLRRSFEDIAARQDALRTSYVARNGEAVAIVHPRAPWSLPVCDGTLAEHCRTEATTPFDIARPPLVRTSLLRLAPDDHVLTLTVHHLVADAWSLGVLWHELGTVYAAHLGGDARPLPPLPRQYADYAAWQHDAMQESSAETEIAWWRDRLAGLPSLELPLDATRPRQQTYRGAVRTFELSAEVTEGARGLARGHDATLFMVLLAAFQALLARHSGQTDFGIGIPVAGRTHPDTEALIGLFLNTLVLRTDLHGDPTFAETIRRAKEATIEALAHQDAPFERVVESLSLPRDLGRSPLFQAMLVLQNAPAPTVRLSELEVAPLPSSNETAKFDLTLSITEVDGGLACALEYASDLFEEVTIERLVDRFCTLLHAAISQPDTPLSRLPLLSHAEQQLVVVEWNQTATLRRHGATVPELVFWRAEQCPDAVAVESGGVVLTYRELAASAMNLGTRLRVGGVGPDTPVGLCTRRSVDMVVGALGILHAGGAYLPLDPELPAARLAHMLDDSRAPVVVVDAECADVLPPHTATILQIQEDAATPTDIRSNAFAASTAYVLYTSGTTGRSKGVDVSHAAFVNLLEAMQRIVRLRPDDVWCAVTSLSFDIAGLELFLPLARGARVHIVSADDARDPETLALHLVESGSTWMQATPATWRMLAETRWRPARPLNALCGGEALPAPLADFLPTRCVEAWNVYGPTETTIWSSAGRIQPSADAPHAGRPLDNTRFYVVDRDLMPTPIGVPGELLIGGAGVARGYRGRARLTAERFVPDPFTADGSRLYRTGDRARWTARGHIQILGRADDQVKIRGFRIELGEIEDALARHPSVAACAVVARGDADDRRLIAYYVPRGEAVLDRDLRAQLCERLPEPMVPSVFVPLDALPLTPNGKIDRRALPEPPRTQAISASQASRRPRTATELALADIWKDVLGREEVSVADNFFESGGHSLLAVRLVARIEKSLDVRLPLAALFEAPTLERLAGAIERGGFERRVAVRLRSGDPERPLFLLAGGGGHVIYFRELVQHLDGETVYGLQPSFDAEFDDEDVIGTWAAQCLRAIREVQPEGPYRLAGHSTGGQLAFEIARRLEEEGAAVAPLVLLDSGAPYEHTVPFGTGWSHDDWLSAFVRLLERVAGIEVRLPPGASLDAIRAALDERGLLPPEIDAVRLRSMLEAFKAGAQASYRPQGPYSGSVLFLRASETREEDREEDVARRAILESPAMGWERHVLGRLAVHRVPGDHVSMLRAPHVTVVAEHLRGVWT
jgi:amino acid adenylation domain-containing protein